MINPVTMTWRKKLFFNNNMTGSMIKAVMILMRGIDNEHI